MAARGPRAADDARTDQGAVPGGAAANREVMDRIATAFDETRKEPWAPVVAFLERLPAGSRVLDLAGGSGRHAGAAQRAGLEPVLLDVSAVLVRLARQNASAAGFALDAVEGDAADVPFRSGAFDAAIYVAGLHCVRGRGARRRTLEELRRVVRPGGQVLVTVWSAEQERFRDIVRGQRRAEMADALTADTEVGDVFVPWARGQATPVERYFHVYSEDELRRDLEEAGFRLDRIEPISLTRSPSPDNWFAYARTG